MQRLLEGSTAVIHREEESQARFASTKEGCQEAGEGERAWPRKGSGRPQKALVLSEVECYRAF